MPQIVNAQNISSILANGENEKTEFKKTIRNFDIFGKIISAFANTKGGIIIVGYDEQYQRIIGISEKEQHTITTFISQLDIQNLCSIYTIIIENKNLLIIEIQKKESSLQLYNGEAYTRNHDAHNVLMSSADIKNYYTTIPPTTTNMETLVAQIASIHSLLIEQKTTSKLAERKNFLLNLGFCFLSAIIGYLLGKFF